MAVVFLLKNRVSKLSDRKKAMNDILKEEVKHAKVISNTAFKDFAELSSPAPTPNPLTSTFLLCWSAPRKYCQMDEVR